MAETTEKAPVAAKKKGGWIVLLLVALLAAGSGFAVPRFLADDVSKKKQTTEHDAKKPAVLPFGDVVVNLGE